MMKKKNCPICLAPMTIIKTALGVETWCCSACSYCGTRVMKIKAIVIEGELPESCYDCDLFQVDKFGNEYCALPSIDDGVVYFDNKKYIHPHCPLVTVKQYEEAQNTPMPAPKNHHIYSGDGAPIQTTYDYE